MILRVLRHKAVLPADTVIEEFASHQIRRLPADIFPTGAVETPDDIAELFIRDIQAAGYQPEYLVESWLPQT